MRKLPLTHEVHCSPAKILTFICENVPADALIHHMTFRQRLISLPLSSAGTVFCDQTGYGSFIQNIGWCPLWWEEETWDLHFISLSGNSRSWSWDTHKIWSGLLWDKLRKGLRETASTSSRCHLQASFSWVFTNSTQVDLKVTFRKFRLILCKQNRRSQAQVMGTVEYILWYTVLVLHNSNAVECSHLLYSHHYV